jgi:hypothetical protein
VKIALICKDKELVETIRYHFEPLSFSIIHSTEPLQFIDTFREERYDLVLFNAMDFPRHWKPILKVLREYYSKEQTVFVLLTNAAFEFEEAAKAIFLGVNGLVDVDITNREEIARLEEIFKRYHMASDRRRFVRAVPDTHDFLNLLFTEPRHLSLIPGTILDISIQGAMFKPVNRRSILHLRVGEKIQSCSMHIGKNIITMECKIIRIGDTIGLEFTSFNNDAHHKLFKYLMERSENRLRAEITI